MEWKDFMNYWRRSTVEWMPGVRICARLKRASTTALDVTTWGAITQLHTSLVRRKLRGELVIMFTKIVMKSVSQQKLSQQEEEDRA